MNGKRPSADILPWVHWAPLMRKAKAKPAPTYPMIRAAENARVVERLAQRNREALDALAELPSDSEPA